MTHEGILEMYVSKKWNFPLTGMRCNRRVLHRKKEETKDVDVKKKGKIPRDPWKKIYTTQRQQERSADREVRSCIPTLVEGETRRGMWR